MDGLNALFDELAEIGLVERCISISPDGQTFTLNPAGRPAMIVGIDDGEGCYDAVAYFCDEPGKWWLALGIATVLGEQAICHVVKTGEAIELVCTPQTWLQRTTTHGNKFACILNWKVSPVLNLAWLRKVRCENDALRSRLEDAIVRFRAPFLIETSDGAGHHAECRHAA